MDPYTDFKELKVYYDEDRWKGSTTKKYHRLVECPDCRHQFIQDIETGCFHNNIDPRCCPKCRYPFSKLLGTKEFNPSERG